MNSLCYLLSVLCYRNNSIVFWTSLDPLFLYILTFIKGMFMAEFQHKPIMLDKVIDYLRIKPDGVYVDGTIGGAGHSYEICRRLKGGTLIGFDKDIDAVSASRKRLSCFDLNICLINDCFENMKSNLLEIGIYGVDGVVLDLGLSSYQLDTPERGFSYRFDSPLDMRMNRKAGLTAWDVVNTYSRSQLEKILLQYGEEKNFSSIARDIVRNRPIGTTFGLVEVIKKSFSPDQRYNNKHFAKRSFQAIRIEVNNELSGLALAVREIASLLTAGGRLVVLDFHSLEDRIIKKVFAELSCGCTCPPKFPVCVCGNVKRYKIIGKKPIVPDQDELISNPRASSCKLRVIEKIE